MVYGDSPLVSGSSNYQTYTLACTEKWLQIQTCILYLVFSFSISHIDIKEKCRLNGIFFKFHDIKFAQKSIGIKTLASLRAVWKLVEKYSCLICNLQGLFFSLHWVTGVYETCCKVSLVLWVYVNDINFEASLAIFFFTIKLLYEKMLWLQSYFFLIWIKVWTRRLALQWQ